MRVVYMGTPDFAVPALRAIYEAGHEIAAVYTQPDRQKGRGKKYVAPPVKAAAEGLGLKVYQPDRLRDSAEELGEIGPDIIVVAAYGQILSERILSIPRYGCINIHASLLPKYRGASPIEASILAGDRETGVTIMYMAKGLDTGDIISSESIEIGRDNTEVLTERLSHVGAELVVRTMRDIEAGVSTRTVQDDSLSTYAGKLTKDMGHIDWSESADYIDRQIRAMYPWPCAYADLSGDDLSSARLKIVEADIVDGAAAGVNPGHVTAVTKKYFDVQCGEGVIRILKLQPEGKKVMDTAAYLNGYKVSVGDMLS